jgi:hypothetical protein
MKTFIIVIIVAVFIVLYSPIENYGRGSIGGNEEDLEGEYADALTQGGLVAGTVFDARPQNQEAGLGWIL